MGVYNRKGREPNRRFRLIQVGLNKSYTAKGGKTMKYRTCILTLCSALGLLGSASGSAYAQKATLVIHNNTNATLAVSAKQVHTA